MSHRAPQNSPFLPNFHTDLLSWWLPRVGWCGVEMSMPGVPNGMERNSTRAKGAGGASSRNSLALGSGGILPYS